jgi:hypothetical protein
MSTHYLFGNNPSDDILDSWSLPASLSLDAPLLQSDAHHFDLPALGYTDEAQAFPYSEDLLDSLPETLNSQLGITQNLASEEQVLSMLIES